MAVARAVVSSPLWEQCRATALIVRTKPTATFGIVGRFDSAAMRRLEGLDAQLRHALPRLRYLDYAAVERLIVQLAQGIIARWGVDAVAQAHFRAIPRGGHIVLGMLGYALELRQDQLQPPSEPGVPTVVVDDVAITGARFKRFLGGNDVEGRCMFAPLLSSPGLRESVERDSRVEACISGGDLVDAAPQGKDAEHDAWLARWRARQGRSRYWIGRTEHVCFPWSEPDIALWNEDAHRPEKGWRLVPPNLCLAHAGAVQERDEAETVRLQVEGVGGLRPADDVVFGEFEGTTLVASPRWQSCLALDGVAAAIWHAVVRCGNESEAATDVARQYDTDLATVEPDVVVMVEDLLVKGALRR